jgi:hypothetical protein
MTHEIQVSFVVTEFDKPPSYISEIMQLSPTKTWLKGDLILKTALKRKSNGWLLKSKQPQHFPVHKHIRSLITELEPASKVLQQLSSTFSCQISCAIYLSTSCNDSNPQVYLDKQILSFLASNGIDLNIEHYIIE